VTFKWIARVDISFIYIYIDGQIVICLLSSVSLLLGLLVTLKLNERMMWRWFLVLVDTTVQSFHMSWLCSVKESVQEGIVNSNGNETLQGKKLGQKTECNYSSHDDRLRNQNQLGDFPFLICLPCEIHNNVRKKKNRERERRRGKRSAIGTRESLSKYNSSCLMSTISSAKCANNCLILFFLSTSFADSRSTLHDNT